MTPSKPTNNKLIFIINQLIILFNILSLRNKVKQYIYFNYTLLSIMICNIFFIIYLKEFIIVKVVAIISEYNPFHLGHLNQIEQIKKIFHPEELVIISIMSGNFIQRGEPSILNKFERCKSAIKNGINLCLEIPVHISLSSAEKFSYGAIKILDSLKCVDYICFGCEIPNEEKLNLISNILIESNKINYSKYLNKGYSFAKVQELMVHEKSKDENLTNLMKSSNNILAIEYLKSLKILNSRIKPILIQRIGSNYNDTSLNKLFSSATAIRNILNTKSDINIIKNHVPEKTFKVLEKSSIKGCFVNKEDMFPYLKYKLSISKNLSKISGVNEGLDNKFYTEIHKSNSLNELILNVKSKRYTYSRLSRILCKFFIGFESYDVETIKNFSNYVRVLGFDSKGKNLLNTIKKSCNINIISKFDKKNSSLAPLDILSTIAYSIINKTVSPTDDFTHPPIIE